MEESKKGTVISKYQTDCLKLSEKSLECRIDNRDNLNNCEEHFEAYKLCRKRENKARRAKNKAKTAD